MAGPQHKALDIARRALDAPAPDRARLIESECAGDPALKSAVRAIIDKNQAHTVVGPQPTDQPTIQSSNGAAPRPDKPEPPAAARTLGDFQILDVLGEGGMGVVYLARQRNPKREVALKVIRPGWMTPRLLKRFEFETAVLARLEHPGIARIYQAGTIRDDEDDIPFFAMEYVRGEPLTRWTANQPVQQRLEMLARVCDAVHHAHQKGVIHRDLKPANILIDAHNDPKVLDFGVARATDADTQSATLQTEVGQVVGTVPYMSPEQIAGDHAAIDTRTDVYSLGVILHQTLTGALPLDVEGKTIVEAARIIAADRPRSIRDADRSLSPELQTIAEHAMEKERDRRYQSAAELAADIRRFIAGEPIAAQPPSTIYQLRKFARRNKPLVAAVAVILLSLSGALAGVSWQAVVASEQRDAARREAAISRSITGYLATMLESADPERSLGQDLTVRQVLDNAAATIEELDDQPLVQAAVRSTLGRTYMSLGELDRAEAHLQASLQTLEASLGRDDQRTVEAARSIGVLRAEQDRFDEAEAIARQSLDTLTRIHGPDHPETIMAAGELARAFEEQGRTKESEELLRELLDRAKRVLGPDHTYTLILWHNLASSLRTQGRFAEAETEARAVLEARTRVFGPRHPQTLHAVNNLATVLQRLGRHEDSLPLLREAHQARTDVLGHDHPYTLSSAQNLANALILLGRLDEAEPLQRDILDTLQRTLGDTHQKTLVALNALAYLLEDRGKLDEALPIYRRAVAATQINAGSNHPETFPPINNLASLLHRLGDLEEADQLFQQLIEAANASLPKDHIFLAIFRGNHADCLVDLQQYDQAEQDLLYSERILRSTLGDANPRTTKAVQRLIRLYEATGDEADAQTWRNKLPEPNPS